MPRQNRVTPDGDLIAVPDRGMFWGNRGRLLNKQGRLARYSGSRTWAICVLEYKGIRRTLWRPDRLTELFFLDEATALAAGHRPCGECRAGAYRAFKAAWTTAHPGEQASAPTIDARLHADRLIAPGTRRTWRARLADLPDSTMVRLDERPWLVAHQRLLAWSPGGYRETWTRPPSTQVTVLTPASTVATLAAGYRPVLHATADGR